jgi:flagellar hook-associated protein 2
MASIQASGINLDVRGLVSQLVAAERLKDDTRISRQETALTVQLSGVSTLKGALSTFQGSLTTLKTQSTFTVRTASVSDETYLKATAGTSAAPGSYDVEVVALAQSHQLASQAFAGGVQEVIGTGTLTLTVNGTSHNIVIDDENNTLAGIRSAINSLSAQTGVQATVINGATGAKLVLTSTKTGAENAMTIAASGGDGGLDVLTYDPQGTMNLTEIRAAQDAHIIIAGTDIYSKTNSVTDAIEGLTLDLKAAMTTPGTTVKVNVTADNAAVQRNVEAFVTAFNKLQETFVSLRSTDPAKKTTGPLFGDSLLRQVEDQIRALIGNPVTGIPGDYTSLASLGITRGLDGKLSLDSTKFNTALNSGPDVVYNVFGSTNGIAARLSTYLDAQLATGASFDFRTTNIEKSLANITKQKEALDLRMAAISARYLKQFTALDSMLTSMQQTSTYLTQQLANLPGAASSGG